MQYAVALAALVATVSAQVAPGTPSGCQTTYPSSFEIAPVNVSTSAASRKRDLIERQATACTSNPIVTLKNGVLTDQNGRTGEIVANHQFQFDNPVQAGRLYDAGFSVCQNGSLAIGGNAVFWGCNSGSFSNLYDQSLGKQCYEIYIDIIPCSGGTTSGSSSAALPAQTAATSAATSAASVASTSAAAPVTTLTTPYTPQMPTVAPVVPVPAASVSPAPYPVGNTTTAAGTPSATGANAPAKSSPLTAPASGASAITVGSTFGVAVAALIAFAML